jgi:hypothetical protein
MSSKRARISDGAKFEDLQALLLKLTRQLRTMGPSGQVVCNLDQIEAEVEQLRARRKTALV